MTQEEKQTKSSDRQAANPLEKVLEEALLTASQQKAKAKHWEPQFSRYVELKQERLLRLAYHITGCWHAASDVVQDTFIALHKQLFRRGFEGSSIGGWLTVVTTNNALAYLRREKTRKASPIEDVSEPAAPVRDSPLEHREAVAEAWKRISRLSEKQRRVFLRRIVDGWPYDMIAGEMDITPGAAKQSFYNAMKKLTPGEKQ